MIISKHFEVTILPNQLFSVFLRLPLSIRILFIALSVVFSFGVIIYIIEPDNFPTIFDGIWWAVITATTVGYGDFVPKTILGKVTGILLILTGAGLISTYLVTIAASTVTRQNAYIEGKVDFKGKKHIVLIGWNERTRELLQSLSNGLKYYHITLIDETLKSHPLPAKNVHFIQGRPHLDETLKKANILEAEKVIITADQSKDELQADMGTILTLIAIKGLNPQIQCIVEILTADQVANAQRAGANEIIQTNNIISFIMLNSLTSQETVTLFLELVNQLSDNTLIFTRPSIKDKGVDFATMSAELIIDGKLLIGIKRGQQTILNPVSHFIIKDSDELIVISN